MICFFFTKGYEQGSDEGSTDGAGEVSAEKPKTLSVGEMLSALAKNRYCMLVAIGFVLFLVFSSLRGSVLVYYLQYNLGNTDLMSAYSIIFNIAGVLPIFFMKAIVKRLGNAKSCVASCILVVIGETIRLVSGDGVVAILIAGWALEGLGLND